MKTGAIGNEPRALQSADAGSTATQKPTGPLAANMREVRQGEGRFTATGMSTAPAGGAPDEISTEDLIARFDKLRAGNPRRHVDRIGNAAGDGRRRIYRGGNDAADS